MKSGTIITNAKCRSRIIRKDFEAEVHRLVKVGCADWVDSPTLIWGIALENVAGRLIGEDRHTMTYRDIKRR